MLAFSGKGDRSRIVGWGLADGPGEGGFTSPVRERNQELLMTAGVMFQGKVVTENSICLQIVQKVAGGGWRVAGRLDGPDVQEVASKSRSRGATARSE